MSLCYPATHPGEDGAYGDGEVSLLAQLHQPLYKANGSHLLLGLVSTAM